MISRRTFLKAVGMTGASTMASGLVLPAPRAIVPAEALPIATPRHPGRTIHDMNPKALPIDPLGVARRLIFARRQEWLRDGGYSEREYLFDAGRSVEITILRCAGMIPGDFWGSSLETYKVLTTTGDGTLLESGLGEAPTVRESIERLLRIRGNARRHRNP